MARLPVGIYQDTTKRIRCIACGLVAPAASDRLCVNCVKERDGLTQHVVEEKAAYRNQQDKAWYALRAATEAADDLLSQRWQRFMDAATLDPEKHASAKRIARSGRVDPLMDLIRLYCQWEDAQAVYQEREQWAARVYQAIRELDTHTVV